MSGLIVTLASCMYRTPDTWLGPGMPMPTSFTKLHQPVSAYPTGMYYKMMFYYCLKDTQMLCIPQ